MFVEGFLKLFRMTTVFKQSNMRLNLPENTPTYMIAVPRCHENLFNHIRQNEEWLSEGGMSVDYNKQQEIVYQKKITTQKEKDKLDNLIRDLRLEKSELFIDDSYHPKPSNMKMQDYVSEFLRNKSVHTYYTFKSFYRVTVFPPGTDITNGRTPEWDQRQEYLIIPLYIILKRGKTYDQMKTLSYDNDKGTFKVEKVNPHHFWKIEPSVSDQEEIDAKNKQIRDKVVNSIS